MSTGMGWAGENPYGPATDHPNDIEKEDDEPDVDPEKMDVDMPPTTAWLLAGPLGSGKSYAANLVCEALERRGVMPHVEEFSNYVRYRYENATNDSEVDDNGLGEWAAIQRDQHGRDHFAHGLASELDGPVPASTHVIVAGVRSPTTPPVFEEYFDDVVTIAMWALPHIRFTRVDEDEEAFDERNEREMQEWECKDFYLDEDAYDYIIPNNFNDEEALRANVRRVVYAEYDGSRDADVFEQAPWHATAAKRAQQREEVRIL